MQLLARLLGSSVTPGRSFGVLELFGRLDRWWLGRYLDDLHTRIRESERAGDTEKSMELCLHREDVKRLLHKRAPDAGWGYEVVQGWRA